MKELGDILGTTITHELGGKVWTFSRITLGIMADFETAMSSRSLQRALKALGDMAQPGERAQIIHDWASRPAMTSMEVYQAEGMKLMLYLALKPNNPDVTEEAVGAMITMDTMPEITALINHLTDPANEPEPGGAKNAPTGKEAGQPQS